MDYKKNNKTDQASRYLGSFSWIFLNQEFKANMCMPINEGHLTFRFTESFVSCITKTNQLLNSCRLLGCPLHTLPRTGTFYKGSKNKFWCKFYQERNESASWPCLVSLTVRWGGGSSGSDVALRKAYCGIATADDGFSSSPSPPSPMLAASAVWLLDVPRGFVPSRSVTGVSRTLVDLLRSFCGLLSGEMACFTGSKAQ